MKYWLVLVIVLLIPIFTHCYAEIDTSSEPFILNSSENTGDNLFGYVNDAWIASHPIPLNKSSFDIFTAIQDNTTEKLKTIYEIETKKYVSGEKNQLGQFYSSGLDTDNINKSGLLPIKNELEMIDSIKTRDDLFNVTFYFVEKGISPFFIYYADQDPTNASRFIAQVEQGGLGLPSRDYYFNNDSESLELQKEYKEHIKNVFLLLNQTGSDAESNSEAVYSIEKEIAGSSYSPVENRDPINSTHILHWKDLEEKYPNTGWNKIASIPGTGDSDLVNVHQLSFALKLDQLLNTGSIDKLKNFLKFKLVDRLSPYLAGSFEDENFRFYSKILNGVEAPEPRWKSVLFTVDKLLPDEAGQKYVEKYFNPESREKARMISHSIRKVFRERIDNLTWMEDTTKEAAKEKIDSIVEKIGYPDTWMDYSGLTLTDSYVNNVMDATEFLFIHGPNGLDKIGKPVNRTVWWMSPQTVNAYYSASMNEIVFPAAIFQSPLFDPNADDAVNYGGIGVVIGHEMTHGFDDMGRMFDKDGNLRDWWSETDAERFKEKTKVLIDQFNAYEVLPGLHANGNLTLGENIADLGGLTLAYHAWNETKFDKESILPEDNLTEAQKFFLSFARVWRGSARDEYLRTATSIDPHSKLKIRANGVPFDIPELYEAFPEINESNVLYRAPADRPVIW